MNIEQNDRTTEQQWFMGIGNSYRLLTCGRNIGSQVKVVRSRNKYLTFSVLTCKKNYKQTITKLAYELLRSKHIGNHTVWKVAKNHTIQFVSNCKYICCKWQSSLVNSLSSHFFLIFLQLTITYQASKGFCGKATVLQYYLFIIFNLTSKMALAWSESIEAGLIEGNLLLCFSALWLLTLKAVYQRVVPSIGNIEKAM